MQREIIKSSEGGEQKKKPLKYKPQFNLSGGFHYPNGIVGRKKLLEQRLEFGMTKYKYAVFP